MSDTDTPAKPHEKWFEAHDVLDNIKQHVSDIERSLERLETSQLPYAEITLDHIIETLDNVECELLGYWGSPRKNRSSSHK